MNLDKSIGALASYKKLYATEATNYNEDNNDKMAQEMMAKWKYKFNETYQYLLENNPECLIIPKDRIPYPISDDVIITISDNIEIDYLQISGDHKAINISVWELGYIWYWDESFYDPEYFENKNDYLEQKI